jgi:hypothetical protein
VNRLSGEIALNRALPSFLSLLIVSVLRSVSDEGRWDGRG